MKNQILNLGKSLDKAAQKSINGGIAQCDEYNGCPRNFCCAGGGCRPIGAPGVICEAQLPKDDYGL